MLPKEYQWESSISKELIYAYYKGVYGPFSILREGGHISECCVSLGLPLMRRRVWLSVEVPCHGTHTLYILAHAGSVSRPPFITHDQRLESDFVSCWRSISFKVWRNRSASWQRDFQSDRWQDDVKTQLRLELQAARLRIFDFSSKLAESKLSGDRNSLVPQSILVRRWSTSSCCDECKMFRARQASVIISVDSLDHALTFALTPVWLHEGAPFWSNSTNEVQQKFTLPVRRYWWYR